MLFDEPSSLTLFVRHQLMRQVASSSEQPHTSIKLGSKVSFGVVLPAGQWLRKIRFLFDGKSLDILASVSDERRSKMDYAVRNFNYTIKHSRVSPCPSMFCFSISTNA